MKNKGFTLIEIMIVMVIMGVLTLTGLTSFQNSQQKGRDAKRKGDVHGIATAFEAYVSDKGTYPADDGNGNIMGCGVGDSQLCPWGGKFSDSKGTVYMVLLPKDPITGRQYYYRVTGGTAYQLYARLENTQDSLVPHGTNNQPQAYSNTSCGGTLCNFGVSSNIKITTGSDLVDDVTATPTPTGIAVPPPGCGGPDCTTPTPTPTGIAVPPPGCGGPDCPTPTP